MSNSDPPDNNSSTEENYGTEEIDYGTEEIDYGDENNLENLYANNIQEPFNYENPEYVSNPVLNPVLNLSLG